MYRYVLEKYKGRASRYTCPDCHEPHEFTRYVDTQTGQYVHPSVGKCNRVGKCTSHYTPRQYFADNNCQSVIIPTQKAQTDNDNRPELPIPALADDHFDTIPVELVKNSTGIKSDFITWLSKYFPEDAIQKVVGDYALGYTKDGRVIFWEIDKQWQVRTGIVMRYDPETGRRVKKQARAIDWIHSIMIHRGDLPKTFHLKQCLFGEHLLSKYPEATVALVESAKSAVIGSMIAPEMIWLATGGMNGFTAQRCVYLVGRDVILYPDLDAHPDWKANAPRIAQEVGCRIEVSELLWRNSTQQQKEDGLDIADFIIDRLQNGSNPKSIAQKLEEERQMLFPAPEDYAERVMQMAISLAKSKTFK